MGMMINGWDISDANAKQRRLTIGHHSITNNSEWNTGSSRPVFSRSDIGWKNVTVEIMVKGSGYADIVKNRGIIIRKLLEHSIVTFDRTPNTFDLILDKYTVDEKVKDRWHIVKLELVGYEYSDEVMERFVNQKQFTVHNPGNLETPVTLFIVPGANTTTGGEPTSSSTFSLCGSLNELLVDSDGATLIGAENTYGGLTISGVSGTDPETGEELEILITEFSSGKTIQIDGETGLITENGAPKIDDVEIWALPTLQPGDNIIRTNGEALDIIVQFKPRWM